MPYDDQKVYYRIKMASGEFHVTSDPPPKGGPWVSKDDPELLRWMGYHGYSLVEELPVGADYTEGNCQRCGQPGTEVHHVAPREVFDDANEWPTVKLCPPCHREWHQRLREWARGVGDEPGLPLGWESVKPVT